MILVNRSTKPPVCKLGDYGKLKYESNKKQRENKKREQETKTLRIRPSTGKHDLDIDIRKAESFLQKGDKVKLECRFRRRELSHPEIGRQKLDYMVEALTSLSTIEKNCSLAGNVMTVLLTPNNSG